jgi:uncharacterized protein
MRPFHYAFKIKDIESTRNFYITILGCAEGRSTENWIDFNFFGNQLSAHISKNIPELDYCGLVDGVKVPIPHFGCVITMEDFERIQKRLEENNISFIIKPQTRYANAKGEQKTMFVLDFSGNPIEFKAFKDESEMFV